MKRFVLGAFIACLFAVPAVAQQQKPREVYTSLFGAVERQQNQVLQQQIAALKTAQQAQTDAQNAAANSALQAQILQNYQMYRDGIAQSHAVLQGQITANQAAYLAD